jgi:hypothetical protein
MLASALLLLACGCGSSAAPGNTGGGGGTGVSFSGKVRAVTLHTLSRAANAIGRGLRIELV